MIAIPTTLSGGEFNRTTGVTDTRTKLKELYRHDLMVPRVVILDPAVTMRTPEWLFLSTGIRAVDHAVEDICSVNATPFSDGASMHALRLLCRGLRAVKADPADLDARLDCQIGAWMSIMTWMTSSTCSATMTWRSTTYPASAGNRHGVTSETVFRTSGSPQAECISAVQCPCPSGRA